MLIVIGIIISMNILLLIISLWTTKALEISAYIYFFFLLIFFIIIIIPLLGNEWLFKKYKEIVCKMIVLELIIYIFGLFIFSINIDYYRKYIKQCPFLLNRLYYSMHLERKCELFNIYRNNRYAFQYICSYNSSKEFKYRLGQEIKENTVICLPFKKSIDNNQIISLFINEYNNNNNYYCFRTNRPKNYTYINPLYCNNKSKYKGTIVFYLFFLIQFISFLPTSIVIGKTFNELENIFFMKLLNKKKEIYDNEIKKTEKNTQLASAEKTDNNISSQENKEKNKNPEKIENIDKEKNNNAKNNIENIDISIKNNEIKENNNNDKNNDAKTSISVVIKNKNDFTVEKDNKNTNISKDYKLSHSNSIHLDQINFGFAINSEADIINKKIGNKN